MRRIIRGLGVLCLGWASQIGFASPEPQAAEPVVPHYIQWRGGLTAGRLPYETALVALLFQLSEARYGSATLTYNDQPLSPERSRKRLEEGAYVHLQTATLIGAHYDERIAFVLSPPIMRRFLGYRQLIIRKRDHERLTRIESLEDLRQFRVGQAAGWPDSELLEKNGFEVVQADAYHSLFPMLVHGRFDLLPLGAGEVEEALASFPDYAEELEVAEGIVLYYPWPVHVMVTRKQPELAERLQFALDIADRQGLIETLFDTFLSEEYSRLNNNNTRVFVLENDVYAHRPEWRQPDLLPNARVIEQASDAIE